MTKNQIRAYTNNEHGVQMQIRITNWIDIHIIQIDMNIP